LSRPGKASLRNPVQGNNSCSEDVRTPLRHSKAAVKAVAVACRREEREMSSSKGLAYLNLTWSEPEHRVL